MVEQCATPHKLCHTVEYVKQLASEYPDDTTMETTDEDWYLIKEAGFPCAKFTKPNGTSEILHFIGGGENPFAPDFLTDVRKFRIYAKEVEL